MCENFHRNLKNIINSYHPKISYYVDKMKEYTISEFNNSIKDLVNINKNESKFNNIYNDIYEFVRKIYKKYKIPFTFNFWKQLEKSETIELYKINLQIINDILNFNGGIDLSLEDLDEDLREDDLNYISNKNINDEIDMNQNKNIKEDDNLFENRDFSKNKTLIKYNDNDFYDLYNIDSKEKEEEILNNIIERKRQKKMINSKNK